VALAKVLGLLVPLGLLGSVSSIEEPHGTRFPSMCMPCLGNAGAKGLL